MAADVDMDGYPRIDRLLRRMFRRSQTLHSSPELFNKVADVVVEQNRRVFESEGAFGGKPWAPLSPAYAAYKVRMVGAMPILVLHDHLRPGLTHRPMNIEIMTPEYYEFGTADRKARWHQDGTENMPARPPVQATAWLNGELARITAEHIT